MVWEYGKKKLPSLVRALGGHYVHVRFEGDYPSYLEAKKASTGYDAPAILARTREALLKVKRGEVKWERDAMVSDSEELPWRMLAVLLRIAATKKVPTLRVIDFGGSLGSLYFWCKHFLPSQLSLNWHVVEQPEHVKVGKQDFENTELMFDYTVDDVLQRYPSSGDVDLLVLSGVVQCLPDPEAFLRQAAGWKIPRILLDRTPLWDKANRLTVQYVPREIYEGSYPAWFLSRQSVLSIMGENYKISGRYPDTEYWEIDGQKVYNDLWLFDQVREQSRL